MALTGFCKIWIQFSVEPSNLCALPESLISQTHKTKNICLTTFWQEVCECVSLLSVWTHPLIFWWRCVMSLPACVSPPHRRQRVHHPSTVKTKQRCIYMSCPLEGRQTLCSVRARHQQDVIISKNHLKTLNKKGNKEFKGR